MYLKFEIVIKLYGIETFNLLVSSFFFFPIGTEFGFGAMHSNSNQLFRNVPHCNLRPSVMFAVCSALHSCMPPP